jgi:hypothetical protein
MMMGSRSRRGIFTPTYSAIPKEATMMSKDRIRFRLSDRIDQKHSNVIAASRAFEIKRHVAARLFEQGAVIICRPSQFGRFIVYRIEEGITINRIAQMEPKLFIPGDPMQPFDVSGNFHDR